ncbi:MAG: alpha/beta hydrolase [Gemmatimonadota bacterium]
MMRPRLGRACGGMAIAWTLFAGSLAAQRSQGMVSLEDATIFYETVGSGDPIVVVHGGPGLDHTYLQPGLDALGNRFELVYYDQRGTGRSSAELNPEAIHIDAFVRDIEALRESLGHERITVLAHSFGSLIGLRYAMAHPERAHALILMNPVEPGTRFQQQTNERLQARMVPEDQEALDQLRSSEAFEARDPGTLSEIYRVAFRPILRDRTRIDELTVDLAASTAQNGQDVARLLGQSLGMVDWWDQLGALETPTLVLHGRYDAPPVEMGQALAEALPAGTFEVLDTGHFPFMEDRDAFLAAVSGFFATVR